jgi:hypothetical protein
MSEQQTFTATTLVDSSALKGSADDLAGLSLQRRTLLFGAAAVAAGALSSLASAEPQAPDLSAALAKFRATIPSHFDREYVNNAVVPFFLGSIFAGEPHSSPTESWKSSGWAGRGDRRRHRVLAVGVSAYFAGAP